MYIDSPALTTRPSDSTASPRKPDREATRRAADAKRPRSATVAARRTRLADAIVSQWLLEQLPADHRGAHRSASDRRELRVQLSRRG